MYVKRSYSIKQEIIAKFCNALANPARVAICQYIIKNGESFFGSIHNELPLSKATVSQHLTVLKDAGLIDSEVIAPHVKYSINIDNWMLATEIISSFMATCTLESGNDVEDGVDADVEQ